MKRWVAMTLAAMCLASAPACLPTVAAVAVYKAAQNKTQNNYRQYVADLERVNQERADRGLAPMPVKSFEEWKR